MSSAETYGRAGAPAALTAAERAAAQVGYFGLEGLDALLPEGLSYDSQVMVTGETGIGKSIFAAQFLYEGLVTGDTCIYVACDEAPINMRQHMAGFRLGTVAYERIGQLLMVDAYGRELSRERRVVPEPTNLDEFFVYQKQTVDEALATHRRVRMVVDSLSTVMAVNTPTDCIEFNSHRLRYLRAHRVLTLDNYVAGVLDERTMAGLSHAYPLIVRLSYHGTANDLTRYIQLGKLKSGMFSASERPFTIDPRTGIVVR
jgi:KaiC/GvpD/RAD55 family RecA-like ATPase